MIDRTGGPPPLAAKGEPPSEPEVESRRFVQVDQGRRPTVTDLLRRIPSVNDSTAVAHRGLCRRGMVYLVGLGPGDKELVTLKAARLLRDADRVYCFDFLRGEVARFARPEALTVVSPMPMGRHVVPGAEGLGRELRERAAQSVLARAEFVSQVHAVVSRSPGIRVIVACEFTGPSAVNR
jgi:hypothetical protein